MLEATLQSEIKKALRDKGYIVIRANPVSPLANGKYKKISPMDKGTPDLIVAFNCKVVFLEIKTIKGTQSLEQKAFQKLCKEKNVLYYVVRSVNEALLCCDFLLN